MPLGVFLVSTGYGITGLLFGTIPGFQQKEGFPDPGLDGNKFFCFLGKLFTCFHGIIQNIPNQHTEIKILNPAAPWNLPGKADMAYLNLILF